MMMLMLMMYICTHMESTYHNYHEPLQYNTSPAPNPRQSFTHAKRISIFIKFSSVALFRCVSCGIEIGVEFEGLRGGQWCH